METAIPVALTDKKNSLKNAKLFRLSHSDQSQIWVEAEDGDKFTMVVSEAAKACQLLEKLKEQVIKNDTYEKQLRELKAKLGNWFTARKSSLKEAYLQASPEMQFFLAVLNENEYNEEIESSLTDLTIEVANNPEMTMLRLDVQSMPPCNKEDVRSFLAIGGDERDGLV